MIDSLSGFELALSSIFRETFRESLYRLMAVLAGRYVELAGQFRRVISVVKVRGSEHSKDIRFFEVSGADIEIGERLTAYSAILTGQPIRGKRGGGTGNC